MADAPSVAASVPALKPGQILIPSPAELRTQRYWDATHRPIHGLLFVLPMIVVYELASLLIAQGAFQPVGRVLAFDLVQQALHLFGANWLYLPGLAVVFIFLFWHLSTREPWVTRPGTIAGMWLESTILAAPIYLLNDGFARQPWLAILGPHAPPGWRTFAAELTVSVGAGIYEELVFRLVLLTLASLVLVDLLGVRRVWAGLLAVLVSGAAFSLYHYLGAEAFEMRTFLFRAIAGVYLAAVFQLRGFGLAVGAHIMYDVMVAVGGWI